VSLGAHAAQEVHHLQPLGGIGAVQWLIQQVDLCIVDDRGGEAGLSAEPR
jgi:hypothetical protein